MDEELERKLRQQIADLERDLAEERARRPEPDQRDAQPPGTPNDEAKIAALDSRISALEGKLNNLQGQHPIQVAGDTISYNGRDPRSTATQS